MLWNLREASVCIESGRIDYAVFGVGTDPLVIIPGLSLRDVKGSGAGLALMYRLLARDYRVYVIDKNCDIAEGCTVTELADDTAAAMNALGISDACVLGVSLGGMIAAELAISYPQLVKKLVLAVTASRVNETMRSTVGRWIELAENGNYCGIVGDMLEVMYSRGYAKRYGWMFPLLARLAKPKNEKRFVRLARACLTCDFYDRLDGIKCDTLVLGGVDDKIVTANASVELAQKLGCELHMYDGLGHSAYEEAHDFDKRVKCFFDFR